MFTLIFQKDSIKNHLDKVILSSYDLGLHFHRFESVKLAFHAILHLGTNLEKQFHHETYKICIFSQ